MLGRRAAAGFPLCRLFTQAQYMSDGHLRAGLLCSYPQPSHSGTATAHGSLYVLLEWLANEDVTLSPKLQITPAGSDDDPTDAAGGLGVVASESLDCLDEVLAAIPKTALLSKRTSPLAEHDRFHPFCDAVHGSGHPQPDVLILATVLACELPAASESRWHGYLQSLPGAGTLDLPAFWPDSTARRWLRGTDVEALLQTQGSDSVGCGRICRAATGRVPAEGCVSPGQLAGCFRSLHTAFPG